MNNRPPAAQLVRQLNTKLASKSVREYISQSIPATIRRELTPERMAKMVIGLFSRTPALHGCTEESIIRSVVECANLGLEPTGGACPQVYLVPFREQCTVIVSRHGFVEMARRAGGFKRLETGIIRRGDVWRFRVGDGGEFYHEPSMEGSDDEPMLAAYCVAYFSDGERSVCVMRLKDIEKRKAVAKSGHTWRTWPDEMAIKTVVKYAAKNWPLSVNKQDAETVRQFKAAIELDDGQREAGTIDAVADLTEAAEPVEASKQLVDKVKDSGPSDAVPDEEWPDEYPAENDSEGASK